MDSSKGNISVLNKCTAVNFHFWHFKKTFKLIFRFCLHLIVLKLTESQSWFVLAALSFMAFVAVMQKVDGAAVVSV